LGDHGRAGPFPRAIERKNYVAAITTAREPTLDLDEALKLLILIALHDPVIPRRWPCGSGRSLRVAVAVVF
jgi:hypothetical protein